MSKAEGIILEETKKQMEKNLGLTFEQMSSMDLGEIEAHIKKKKGLISEHIPRLYQRCRDVISSQGKFLTREQHEKDIQELTKRYLNLK